MAVEGSWEEALVLLQDSLQPSLGKQVDKKLHKQMGAMQETAERRVL